METLTDLTTVTPEDFLNNAYAENFPWFENYIRRFAGSTTDAQDIFQESIAAAWINLREGRFKGDIAQFNAYLRQICKHKWINLVRSATRNRIVYDDEFSGYDQNCGDQELLDSQLRQSNMLQRCMLQLGSKCKMLLGLFYYRRKSLGEIAKQLGNTEESVKTIKYRCMMKLRKLFLGEIDKYDSI